MHASMLFSHQVMSNSLQPHGLQHVRPPYSSSSPGVCPSSCPLNQWYYPIISSSVSLFPFCLQSFPPSRSFPLSRLFASGGQSIGVSTSVSASVLPVSIQGGFPLVLTGLIFFLSKGLSRVMCIYMYIHTHTHTHTHTHILYVRIEKHLCQNFVVT